MSMDSELQNHYALLLGIGSPWEVKTVDLSLEGKKVEIELGWQWGAAAKCPECGRECSIQDCAPERRRRHLDTMQFTTLNRARTPRADCPEHGVKTMQVPWAAPQGRFTLLFERFAVEVLLASASVSQACALLGIGWDNRSWCGSRRLGLVVQVYWSNLAAAAGSTVQDGTASPSTPSWALASLFQRRRQRVFLGLTTSGRLAVSQWQSSNRMSTR